MDGGSYPSSLTLKRKIKPFPARFSPPMYRNTFFKSSLLKRKIPLTARARVCIKSIGLLGSIGSVYYSLYL